jgi:hypothetical protein
LKNTTYSVIMSSQVYKKERFLSLLGKSKNETYQINI